jgi:cysteinyl-tRNA synthetase
MRIYNTLSRSIEEFKPIDEVVKIYTCGPTVYDFSHIGNLRTFILSDLFERVLRFNNFKIKTVQNITDIDDKIINRAKEREIEISELSSEFEKCFLDDISKINILPKDINPHATDYVPKMQDFIKVLLEKGLAYREEDGSVYFDISKFDGYGRLSGIESSTLKTGTRVLSDDYTKEDVQDFAVWKSVEEGEVGYESPWGFGRPGWHIECSVMSQECLAETIDAHIGGIDLIFPHHENEIAQSEAKTGQRFVNYWIHGAHILVEGKKMSKSLGNFYRLKEIEEKGFDPMSLRYLYLQTHYRQEMNFTWASLEAAQTALNKLRNRYIENSANDSAIPEEFVDAINNDLNFPKALAVVWENIDFLNKEALDLIDSVLGLGLAEYKEEKVEIPEEVRQLVDKREEERKKGNYSEADMLREKIENLGYLLEDSTNGQTIKKKQ